MLSLMEVYSMTDNSHPITPPPELVRQWCHEDRHEVIASPRWFEIVCTKAARWGANQELNACCADVQTGLGPNEAVWLRSVRRPKPPSLKEQALQALYRFDDTEGHEGLTQEQIAEDFVVIRRALESLP